MFFVSFHRPSSRAVSPRLGSSTSWHSYLCYWVWLVTIVMHQSRKPPKVHRPFDLSLSPSRSNTQKDITSCSNIAEKSCHKDHNA